jgi:hypothetical protein
MPHDVSESSFYRVLLYVSPESLRSSMIFARRDLVSKLVKQSILKKKTNKAAQFSNRP